MSAAGIRNNVAATSAAASSPRPIRNTLRARGFRRGNNELVSAGESSRCPGAALNARARNQCGPSPLRCSANGTPHCPQYSPAGTSV